MILKKLKINGFKSFAKPLTIDFDSPLTAIVGPNGSGKSNIVDAIRWVLGEQSAKSLRGSRMADVIFAGSDAHKALKKASVTLYLDNSKGILPLKEDEVTIARRVSDSGESDYLLNGSVCRLKDIEEILMDTGLGTDSYSIVGQGKISSIINSKPKKLREFFEEAAGISKHKFRKSEAEDRLEKTNHNLQRIDDIIEELKKQQPSLKKASEKAKKYNRLHSELSELEISLLLDEWDNNNIELNAIKSDQGFLRDRLNSKKNYLNSINNDRLQCKQNLKNNEEKLNKYKDLYYSVKTKIEEIGNRLNILAEKRKGKKREKHNLINQIEQLSDAKSKLLENQKDINDKIERIKSSEKELKEKKQTRENLVSDKRQNLNQIKERLESYRDNALDDNGELKNLDGEVNRATERIKFANSNIKDLMLKKEKLEAKLEDKKEDIKKQKEKIVSLKDEKLKLKRNDKELAVKENNLRDRFQELNDTYEKLAREKNKLESRLDVLSNMDEEYDGYYRGVKNLLKQKKDNPGIIGVIADLIKVDKKYESALETALGSRLQNIVVKDDYTARKGVEFLKNNKLGRATFLPLNMVNGRKANITDIKNMSGFLGLASDLVSFDSKIKSIVDYLLGRTLIVSNLKAGTKIAKKINSRLKIVTLDSDLINPGGAITGGSSKNNSRNLLGRSRKIKELKQNIIEIDEVIDVKSQEGLKIKSELENVENERQKYNKNLHQLELKNNNYQNMFSNYEKEFEDIKENIKQINKDLDNNQTQLRKNKQRRQELAEKIKEINNNFSREKDKIENEDRKMKIMEREIDEINEKITELKVEIARTTQNLDNLIKSREEIKKNIEENRLKTDESKNNFAKVEKEIDEINKKVNNFKERREKLKLDINDYEQKCNIYDADVQKIQERLDELNEKFQSNQDQLNKLKDELHKVDLKANRLENQMERYREKLIEDYDLDPENKELDQKRIKITDYKSTKSKIKELKNAIKKLGIINQGAVQEFEELTSRLEYLREQKEDLVTAKESIVTVIKEIEKNMGQLFYDTFTQIKGKFESVFQELFSGGQAEVRLTDPENYLETGVEISAQPPGKQLKKLSLMSGGERALTAIALVFAFLQVNPSPFYILDEIDAPLDESNVVRFANFIRKYSEFTQFIVISHRKRMMTRVETIYGVTMEESGISKLVSLRLQDVVNS